MDATENSILESIKRKEENILQKLFMQTYRPLVMYASRYLDTFQDAEDIVQDVFVKIHKSDSLFNIETKLYAYLYRIVKNACFDHLKKQKQIKTIEWSNYSDVEDATFIDETLWENYVNRVYMEIELLPEKTKIIFKSIVLEKRKYKEVAEELNISVNTIKTTLARAFAKLKTDFQEEDLAMMLLISFYISK